MFKQLTVLSVFIMPLCFSTAYAQDVDNMKTSGSAEHSVTMAAPTGDPDKDFVAHMIPHHEGAVAEAKTLLKTTKDPVLTKLAKRIIKGQEREIAIMKKWQAEHP